VDETAVAGIDHQYSGGREFFTGGGVAAFDCNGDGLPDLFFAGGSGPAALYRNDSQIGGALRFTRIPSPVTDLIGVTGVYPLDIDSDGHVDLVLLRVGGNVVLRGLGDCQFERANETFGIYGGNASTMAFSATGRGRTGCRRWRSATTSRRTGSRAKTASWCGRRPEATGMARLSR
jgi:hypothetical protein